MRARIAEELVLLCEHYTAVEHLEQSGDDWFRIPYRLPDGWRVAEHQDEVAPAAFRVSAGYPTAEPYGFYLPAGINFRGASPSNPGSAVAPPFHGDWQHFSWSADGSWAPSANVRQGSNLLAWARSFRVRLMEGA